MIKGLSDLVIASR